MKLNTETCEAKSLPARWAVAGAAPASAPELRAGSVVEFMVMPAGTHTCHFGQGGRTVERTVLVDPAAVVALNAQLRLVNRRGPQRAFFDFDHEDKTASGWPVEFFWSAGPEPSPAGRSTAAERNADPIGTGTRASGVYCRVELSQAGADAIRGRNYRAFSPVFYVNRENPARVICRAEAGLNFGSLVNDPAFHEIAPLWAGARAADVQPGAGEPSTAARVSVDALPVPEISTAVGAAAEGAMVRRAGDEPAPLADPSSNTNRQETKTRLAPGESKGATMEGQATAETAPAAQPNPDAALRAAHQQIAELETRAKQAEEALSARRKRDAAEAVATAVQRGAIPAQDQALQARWRGLLEADPENALLLAAQPAPSALGGSVTRNPALRDGSALEAKEGPRRVLQAYGALVAKNSGVQDLSFAGFKQKGEHARDMAALYAGEIAPRWNEFRDLPLLAADNIDPAGNLGTLSGTLVAQRTLQLFKLEFPIISRIFTDFSDTPAQFKQTEATRVVVVPAVQSYSTAADATGRPVGWSTVSAAQTKDVLITLDEHVGVPILFDANTLASTMRRLFDEQAPAAAYSLAKYFVEKIYRLFTPANFNAYAKAAGVKVPTAYPVFAVALEDFARSSLTKLAAIFNPNEVPLKERVVLLNSPYFEQLATDPSLVTFFAGQRAPEIVTANRLPRLAGFEPIEAPNLAAPAVTPNLVGMALHKAAVVAKTRLSNDYTQALPGASYGSVTTVTDPDIGISVVLVQYVNHTGGYAEWRIQVMLGAAVGDTRGGLCLTSQ